MDYSGTEKYISSVSIPNIEQSEEKALFLILKDENSTEFEKQNAIDKICGSHIRFVSQFAYFYGKKSSVDVEDLIGAGVIGMMSAIDRFDVTKDHKFATYCGWWIKLEMIKLIKKSNIVSVPQHVYSDAVKYQNAIAQAESGTISEDLDLTEKQIKNINKANIQYFSIDTHTDDKMEDVIDGIDSGPYNICEKKDLMEKLLVILSELDEKTYEIVMSKHLDDKVLLDDLSKKYGVSIERIRQIRVNETNLIKKKLLKD